MMYPIFRSRFVWLASAIAILSGCASTPPDSPLLAQAQSDYMSAAADPQITHYATVELKKAADALDHAQRLHADRGDSEAVAHYAYLATQYSATARQIAKAKSAQQVVASAGDERNRILLSARTQEAEREKQKSANAEQQVQLTEERARALEQKLSELNAKRTNRGVVLTLPDVLFDVGHATLKPGAHHTIDRLAEVMKESPDVALRVEGFTDSVGSEEYNMMLSRNRAEAVRHALVDRGIDASRIDARGYGESLPIASNKTASGRQANRRVEIVLSDAHSKMIGPSSMR
jgi:outer membrane protein OmpA-like peptidoglycan-associated protein